MNARAFTRYGKAEQEECIIFINLKVTRLKHDKPPEAHRHNIDNTPGTNTHIAKAIRPAAFIALSNIDIHVI